MLNPWPMFDRIVEFGQALQPSSDLITRLRQLAQPHQRGMIGSQSERSTVEVGTKVLHGFDDSQQLPPGHTVIPFRWNQGFAKISHYAFPSVILNLGKNSSHRSVTRIRIEDILSTRIGITKDWRLLHQTLQFFERALRLARPTPGRILLGQLCKRAGDICVVRNILAIVPS